MGGHYHGTCVSGFLSHYVIIVEGHSCHEAARRLSDISGDFMVPCGLGSAAGQDGCPSRVGPPSPGRKMAASRLEVFAGTLQARH